MSKIYEPQYYKWLTLTEGNDWDIQSDEFEDPIASNYEKFKDYVKGLEITLRDLVKKGQKNSEEFRDTLKLLQDIYPEATENDFDEEV